MSQPTPSCPNVVVFFTDQQRWDASSLHGNPLDIMPNFDRLARGGTHLANSFTCQPVCGPARACLQSGLYPTTTGCFKNGIPLPPGTKALGHYFTDAGYRTGYIGKWHLGERGHQAVRTDYRGGYQYWLAANALELCSDSYRTVMYDNECNEVRLPGYRVDALTDAAIRFIAGGHGVASPKLPVASEEAVFTRNWQPTTGNSPPFFLFLSYLEPHHQNHLDDYPPPDGYRERYAGRWTPPDLATLGGSAHRHLGGYWGMIKRLDEALGRLVDALKSMGILDNTIILFTSDHGCHFRTRNAEYKRSCHESSIRVPTMLCGPGFKSGGQITELISLVDLPPTLLDAAGIAVPKAMQGRSILPLIRRQPVDWPKEMFVQISESQVGRAIRTGRWKYGVTAPDVPGNSAPGADRYVEEYLYDLQADPYELANLVGLESHRALCDELRRRLISRMVQAGEQAPTIDPAPSLGAGRRQVTPEEIQQ